MWAHYTENYHGFALEWKGTEVTVIPSLEQTEHGTFVKVIDPKKLVKIKKEYPFANQYMLTTKLKHWEYENEWGFLNQVSSDENRILHYDPEKIKGLYIGHQMIDNKTSSYRTILTIHSLLFPEAPIYVVYPHPTDIKLFFEKVI